MSEHSVDGLPVVFYFTDEIERDTLTPVARELARRGCVVRGTSDFRDQAEIGLYACHSNRFFDFSAGRWTVPSSRFSVIALHDLGQANDSGELYFENDSWHVFDLGLLPGPAWMSVFARAVGRGIRGPRLGVRVGGWPKGDHASGPEFDESCRRLRDALGLDGSRKVLLLGCSWSDRQQLTDVMRRVDHDRFDVVVKYPSFPPPPNGSPWFDRLVAAREELGLARHLAENSAGVRVATDGSDVYALVTIADVVLSNGSNLLYEGVLMGTAGVSVRDWVHPAGRDGSLTALPYVDLEGVLTAGRDTFPAMLDLAVDPAFASAVASGHASLVKPNDLGRSAVRAADEILTAYRNRSDEAEGSRSGGPGASTQLWGDDVSLREALDAAAERESRARDQLAYYESELLARQRALQAADERELNARARIAHLEEQVAELLARTIR